MKIADTMLNDIVIGGGFVDSKFAKDMFFTKKVGDIKQVFCPTFVRKRGSVRFGGYIGIYFLEFEEIWKDSRKNNPFYRLASPSFVISISNFLDLSDIGVFSYTDSEELLLKFCKYVYNKCKELPSTAMEFDHCAKEGKILDRNISDYVNVYDSFNETNSRLIKLANLLRWLGKEHGIFLVDKKTVINEYQARAIEGVPEDYYYVR